MKTQSEKVKAQSASDRKPGTQPSHPLDDYTGDYEHPGYGQLSITKEADRLKGVFNALELPLEHYHYDVFEAVMEFAEMRVKVAFSGDLKGGIESVSIPFEPTGKPIIFKRMPDKRMMNKDFLDQFTGKYEVMNMILSVTLREDNTLMASIPGQPDVELVPYQGTMFSVKGREGFSIEFKKDEANAVTEAVITQPGGSMVAKKQ